jgi:hypothetical protein
MSYKTDDERDRILKNLVKTTKMDLGDSIKREQSKLRQSFNARFEEEIKQAEECSKGGDFINVILHYRMADLLNDYLKTLGPTQHRT